MARNTSDMAQNTSDMTKNTSDMAKNTWDMVKNTTDIAKNYYQRNHHGLEIELFKVISNKLRNKITKTGTNTTDIPHDIFGIYRIVPPLNLDCPLDCPPIIWNFVVSYEWSWSLQNYHMVVIAWY